ncbi:hypothetical protein GCM10009836_70510 [Pseudonocardia ailaonensis]|uniref:DUF5666 domain-containing protein n=1 Tax=Pseudonocardia ailaonensis TaxID=367279 RepID=A0ABN2NS15_9PSEU
MTTQEPVAPEPEAVGFVDGMRRRRPRLGSPLWLWAIMAAVFSLGAVYALVQCTPSAAVSARLLAGDTALLPLPGEDLRAYTGRTVTAESVPVESVPADEGFWVGTGTDRVWVELVVQPGESPYTVRPGDLVTFTGRMVAHDATFGPSLDLTGDDAAQLARQGAHIEVAKAGLGKRPA